MGRPKHFPFRPLSHHAIIPMCRGQLLEYNLQRIVQAAGRECGAVDKARTYSVQSHLAAMVFVQLAHALSLHDVCN